MPNAFDGSIKLLYAADKDTDFVADTVTSGADFDLVADVEIGENLNQNVDKLDLFVGVKNMTQSSKVITQTHTEALIPDNKPRRVQVRVPITSTWSAAEGDALQAIATLKITARFNNDFSYAESNHFVVVA